MSTKSHKARAPKKVQIGIITVSTTRSLGEDKSGHWISKRARKEKHEILFHKVVKDDAAVITATVVQAIREQDPPVLLLSGGTGITSRDVTIEALRPIFNKELTSFGPLFAQLSYEQIDSAAILSRATAGVINKTIVFCIPGSLKACKLACKYLIFPELGHLVKHVRQD